MTSGVSNLAPVERGVAYPLAHFMKIVGLGRHGLRAARRAGLRVRRAHGHAYVIGDDWLSYLDQCDREEAVVL